MTFFTELITIDRNILLWIQEYFRQDWMTSFWRFVTFLGDGGWFWIVMSLILLIPRKTRRVGITALLALGIGALITNVALKNIVARTRPYEVMEELVLLVNFQTDFSFPSGHSCASFAAAMVYYWMLPRKYGIPAVVLAALIAFSRLYVGVHYPSDVIVGIAVGIFAARLLYVVQHKIEKKKEAKIKADIKETEGK